MAFAETIRLAFSPPHPAGRRFIIIGIVAFLIGLVFWRWLAWLGLLFTAFCFYFFRDPERVPPGRVGAIVAPADGVIVSITASTPPPELGLGPTARWKIGIFLSVLNVHVNRIPVDGTITRIAYRHGLFVNASLNKASDQNERNGMAIRLNDGQDMAVVQIAGLIARRIVCDVREGDTVRTGARFGIIRFGSRTDVYLPEGLRPLVAEGQTMIGGETVLAVIT
jgi:phosphatidylserine decarboxylase